MRLAFVGVATAAAAALLIVPWRLVPTDAYLALVAGREIVQHGLPHADALTVVTAGRPWTDQQWLGQLAIYGAERVAGLAGTVALEAIVIACAFGICARYALSRGASPAATFVSGLAGFAIGAASFTVRPQMFSLAAFAALLALLAEDARTAEAKPTRARVFWCIPILAVWANVHGAVVLGAMLVGLRAMFDVAQGRARRGVLLGALAAVTPFCTPYARELPRYFHDIGHLQDPARELPIVEWNRVAWPDDWPIFAIVLGVVVLFVVVYVKKLARPAPFETVVVALAALGAWQATRHLQWLGLAVAAYAPMALDAAAPVREGRVLALVASASRVLGPIALVVFGVRLFAMKPDSLERNYPRGALATLEKTATEHPDWHIATSDYFADWTLWNVPAFRGRVESDVRFELLDDAQARAMMRFQLAKPGWDAVYPDANVYFVSRTHHVALDHKLATLPAATTLWENEQARIVAR